MSENFRLCLVTPICHPSLGGLGKQSYLLLQKLAAANVEILVLTRRISGMPSYSHYPNVRIITISTPWPHLTALEKFDLRGLSISMLFSLKCAWLLLKNRRNYDIVHFQGARVALYINLALVKYLGKKVLTMVSGAAQLFEAGSLHRHSQPIAHIFMCLLRRVDIFVAISNEIRRGLIADGVAEAKIVDIPTMVDLRSFTEPGSSLPLGYRNYGLENRQVVVYCGRLAPFKGLEFLLRAWSQIIVGHSDAALLLVGDGLLRQHLEQMMGKLAIKDSVYTIGWQTQVELFLRPAAVFVLPSLREGLSNSLLEAMALGLPVVATRISGNVDVIEDQFNGLLVPPGESEALAQAIGNLLADRQWAQTLGQNAQKTVRQHYDIDRLYLEYLQVYRKLSPGSPTGKISRC